MYIDFNVTNAGERAILNLIEDALNYSGPPSDYFYGYPTTALPGHETELTVIIDLTEISMNVGDPVQWYITTPSGETITGEIDTLKCCIVGSLYDKAYYNFPEYGTYTIRVEFPGYIRLFAKSLSRRAEEAAGRRPAW